MCLPITPYKVEREWKHAGLSCAVVQRREAGFRCGYVRVPPGHPLHGKDYDAPDVDVHGGLSFAEIEPCNTHEDGVGWWFGWDCYHAFDMGSDPNVAIEDVVSPRSRRLIEDERDPRWATIHGEHFWTEPEVVAETERLAEQLAAVTISSAAPPT
jgi:hypothetical protein